MPLPGDAEDLLSTTRELLREAQALVDGSDLPRTAGQQAGVLGLYESLCRALDGTDPARVRSVLGRIAQQVDRLKELAADVERLRSLRKRIRPS